MNGFAKYAAIVLLALSPVMAADPATFESIYAEQDAALQLDPVSAFWNASSIAYIEKDSFGNPVPAYRTEVRARWTSKNLYLLFVCPYKQLHLKPNPTTQQETNQLWNWDVAEAFIGSDFADIQRYKEFEVSPQGEWVDLDINLHSPHHEDGWTWNSGFEALAKIDVRKHVWYAAMRIPFSAIDTRPPASGNTLRLNLFRSGGPRSHPYGLAWQPPMSKTFHTPERFGLLKLVKKGER
jgi:hypothetical protein